MSKNKKLDELRSEGIVKVARGSTISTRSTCIMTTTTTTTTSLLFAHNIEQQIRYK